MKIAALIARLLLGIMFFFFGLNGFLNFLKAPLPPGLAGQYMGALFTSHYLYLVAAGQLIGGLLLLINRAVPFGLVLLAAELANIWAFHLTMMPTGFAPGVIATILWLVVAYRYKAGLIPLFR